jgi:hypothetical protein
VKPELRNPVLGSLGGQIERRFGFWTIRDRILEIFGVLCGSQDSNPAILAGS